MANQRPLHTIAHEISSIWRPVHFAAVPYLEAMKMLDTIEENYGMDSGKSIVLYFLSNCVHWRGEDARRIKAELRKICGV